MDYHNLHANKLKETLELINFFGPGLIDEETLDPISQYNNNNKVIKVSFLRIWYVLGVIRQPKCD